MTKSDNDLTVAKRLSLLIDADRCHASSSAAPHANLSSLVSQMLRLRTRLREFEEQDEELDPGWMAERLRRWAGVVGTVINKCNSVERQRSDTVFEAIDWYNKNLDAVKKDGAAMCKAGKQKTEEEMRAKIEEEVQQVKVEMEKKMEELKQKYEERLTKAGVVTTTDGAKTIAAFAIPTPASSPSDSVSTSSALPTNPASANPISAADAAQISFWKSKYESLADQNAELPKAKVADSTVEDIVHDEIEKIKQHYEMQIEYQKARAEELVDKNADLRRQLQECASPGEKRKAYDDMEDEYGGADGGSSKRARTHEG